MPKPAPFRYLATTLVLVVVLMAHARRAEASLFIVDTVAVDLGDHNPGDNKCEWHTIVPVGQRCSLRAAIEEANAKPGKDTILFPAGLRYEMLVADDHDITEDVVIGSGVTSPDDRPVLDANDLDRMFEVHGGAELTLEEVVVTGGAATDSSSVEAGSGGAILVFYGASLVLEGVALLGNGATIFGNALASFGTTLSISDTYIEGNRETPGALSGRSTIYVSGSTATITRSALANNGAGFSNIELENAVLIFSNSTIAGNTGNGITVTDSHLALQNVTILGGLYNGLANGFSGFGGSTMTVVNSIINACDLADTSGLDSGRNLSILGGCGLDPIIDFPQTNPQLGSLRDNGGWTPTLHPEPGSPVIDQGTQINCPSEDQRGAPRTAGVACELGAMELMACNDSHGWNIEQISIFYVFEFLSCYWVHVGPAVEVVAGGSPTFRTRDVIRLGDGFSVRPGGEIAAIIDPTAGSGITLP